MQSSQIHSRNNNAGARARNSASGAARSSYKRALCGLLPWRQPEAADASPPATTAHGERLLWLSSLKAAAAVVARAACIYEPLCSTGRGTGVHAGAVAPRRVMTRSPVGRAPEATLPAGEWDEDPWRAFRRRTLTEDLLMPRFVLKEKAARRRMMMEVAAKRYGRTWMPPPASRLSLMSLAEDDDVAEEEAGESGSSSLRCGQDQPL